MTIPKISGAVVVSLLATGALLSFAQTGFAGQTIKKIGLFISRGFGI